MNRWFQELLLETVDQHTDRTDKNFRGTLGETLLGPKGVAVEAGSASARTAASPTDPKSVQSPSATEQRDSLQRLVRQGWRYIQITTKTEEIYIALTDPAFHDLTRYPGRTVYHVGYLIELSDEEIRLMHSLRTIGARAVRSTSAQPQRSRRRAAGTPHRWNGTRNTREFPK